MSKPVFDAIRFFQDYSIDYRVRGTSGWVNIHCPFCTGIRDYHLGIHPETGGWKCWRCGKKNLTQVLQALLGPIAGNSSEIRGRYVTGVKRLKQPTLRPKFKGSVKLPPGTVKEAPERARKYLEGRGLDPDYLEDVWKIQYTGFTGKYKFRIIAPIFHRGRLVSYQGRDYTGKSGLRYKACPKEEEARLHQHCLYGEWLVKGNRIVAVEGIADAWRLGPGAVALFGIDWTMPQAFLLSQYDEITIIFDSESQAMAQAEKLALTLKTLKPKIKVNIIEIADGDPGELSQEDADELMTEILGERRI